MARDLFILPLGGGLEPSQYYTKEEIDQLIAPFITNTVDDLANYYLKTETYTKAETEALVGRISAFEVVSTLPTSDIKTNVIYLLGPTGQGDDRYEEYIYSESTWVKIGETSIDLSNYVTTSMLSTALASYTTTSDLTTLLADKADEDDLTALETVVERKQDILTAGENITIENNVISASGGGGGDAWYGTQAQFDALGTYDVDTDYFITDKIDYKTDIKGKPNLSVYATKAEVNTKNNEQDDAIAGKMAGKFMTQAEFDALGQNIPEGDNYFIEGNTVQMVVTFQDQTTATYNVVID